MASNILAKYNLDADIIKISFFNAVLKLSPLKQIRNPIMFSVYVSAIMSSGLFIHSVFVSSEEIFFILGVSVSLWITIFFANLAESMAEVRGKYQTAKLRKNNHEILAKKLSGATKNSKIILTHAATLKIGDLVLVESQDFIPGDGEVVEGIASVNEGAITGESAPVIRESGGDRSGVTGGTQVISDWIVIRITANAGETFLDKMTSLIEGVKRHKTPNELSLIVLLSGFTIVFLFVCVVLLPVSIYSVKSSGNGTVVSLTVLISLFVCLSPTTIGGLLSAVAIAGMNRMLQANVIVLSSKVVETAGDVDTLILDKTGTITLGDRQATEFIPVDGVDIKRLADSAQLASLADETPEGRSIVVLAKVKYGLRDRKLRELNATFIPFSAETRISGANLDGRQIRKGAAKSIEEYVIQQGGEFPDSVRKIVISISKQGGTALVVAEEQAVLGVIHLKDIIKGGLRRRFAELRRMGIKTIMVTGDNHLTAAAIAAESGVDDFIANSTPEDKLKLVRTLQSDGHLVAMAGDGMNDAPALAQSNVAVAMNSGAQSAKEAGNLVDLDSNPTKLIEVVEIGKQLLMTRGALTTFSLATDVSKSFVILPAVFISTYPALESINFLHLSTPNGAILSAVIFNALVMGLLIPLALGGIKSRGVSATQVLLDNVFIYGVGGLIVPFVGIKLIDMILTALNLI